MRLRPLLVSRFANAFGGAAMPYIVLAVLAGGWDPPDDTTATAIVVAFAAVALVLAVRGFRLGVVCGPATITVRGYSRSRTIPIAEISEVQDVLLASVRWRDGRGRVRKTPMLAFSTPMRVHSSVAAHAESSLQQLQHWIERHR
ncbi:hypothetical protein HCN51_51040 [Nonomuraea sp. FMUSA5-5]|uniref:PH domain-containing protein n=1 Tax=Nonomuraea composti TaxID=2720023 RepID=A0ABX1BIW5_9ACTN|nr:hypothetical protein [Nonomuraea sp. FMUSA5-5]NJP97676.1 hypothetical protein [Nonomuraea sp. FMUSA5-5]